MQYKIPIQIENEDVIVAGLSLRQLSIMMLWGGIGYGIFKFSEPRIGLFFAIAFGAPFVLIGIVTALMRISEMTFLPIALNFFRLSLNAKSRIWSQGADSYSEMDIGYVAPAISVQTTTANKSYEQITSDEFSDRMQKL